MNSSSDKDEAVDYNIVSIYASERQLYLFMVNIVINSNRNEYKTHIGLFFRSNIGLLGHLRHIQYAFSAYCLKQRK